MNIVKEKSRNFLSHQKSFRLCSHLQALHAEGTLRVSDTFESLAEACAISLGFPLTTANVRHAFDTLEIQLPQPPKSKEQQLEARILRLEAGLAMLCKELQLPLPA